MALSPAPTGPPPYRILVVDDHPLVRDGLRSYFTGQPDLVICGEAASAAEARHQLADSLPDLAIMELQFSDSQGVSLIKEIHQQYPSLRILVVSAFDEGLYAERALRAGALGYINKREAKERIFEAVRTVLADQRYISAPLARRLLAQEVQRKNPFAADTDPVHGLSDRELEVFRMIGRGETTSAIARKLGLSIHTIDTHREKIRHKLGAKNSAELMQKALQWHLENG